MFRCHLRNVSLDVSGSKTFFDESRSTETPPSGRGRHNWNNLEPRPLDDCHLLVILEKNCFYRKDRFAPLKFNYSEKFLLKIIFGQISIVAKKFEPEFQG